MDTTRIDLGNGQWADMTREVNTKAFTILRDSFDVHDRPTQDAMKEAVVASTRSWSFGDRVSVDVLDYEVSATQYNQMLDHLTGIYTAIGGQDAEAGEPEEEKKRSPTGSSSKEASPVSMAGRVN